MTSKRVVYSEHLQAKRELRAQSARLRRRINADVHGVIREQARLRSWRTWVRRFPLPAIAVAFSAGLAASLGMVRVRAEQQNLVQSFLTRWAVPRLMQWATSAITGGLLTEILKAWTSAASTREPARAEHVPDDAMPDNTTPDNSTPSEQV